MYFLEGMMGRGGPLPPQGLRGPPPPMMRPPPGQGGNY